MVDTMAHTTQHNDSADFIRNVWLEKFSVSMELATSNLNQFNGDWQREAQALIALTQLTNRISCQMKLHCVNYLALNKRTTDFPVLRLMNAQNCASFFEPQYSLGEKRKWKINWYHRKVKQKEKKMKNLLTLKSNYYFISESWKMKSVLLFFRREVIIMFAAQGRNEK